MTGKGSQCCKSTFPEPSPCCLVGNHKKGLTSEVLPGQPFRAMPSPITNALRPPDKLWSQVWKGHLAGPSSRIRTSSSWLAISSSSVSPLPYWPFDLRWQLFQGNSRTLIRNRPGLIDDTKLAPASRLEGVILNYSDLLGGGTSQDDLGACLLARHVAMAPSNLRQTPPV